VEVTVRPAGAADAKDCGRICHDAFAAIASRHGFPPDFPSVEIATGLLSGLIAHPGFFAVVAEQDGRVVGSNFLDERSMIFGVGPVTVDPAVQDRQIGRALMNAVLARTAERRAPGVRLLQAAYHNRSMCLYAKLGFDIREPFAVIQGNPLALEIPGCTVRPATDADIQVCNALCTKVHGHDRGGELRGALAQGSASGSSASGESPGIRPGLPCSGTRSPRPTTISLLSSAQPRRSPARGSWCRCATPICCAGALGTGCG
jgi:GNAT superfamily N-acetyltransferase